MAAVRRGRWERHPGHLGLIQSHLGPRPPPQEPGSLAVWVAALINPLPSLGVAPEIRLAILAAETPLQRVNEALGGLRASLHYLQTQELSLVHRVRKLIPPHLRPVLPVLVCLAVA